MEQYSRKKTTINSRGFIFNPFWYLGGILICFILIIFNVVNYVYLNVKNYSSIETFSLLIFVFYFYFAFCVKTNKSLVFKNKMYINTFIDKMLLLNIFSLIYYFKNKTKINMEVSEIYNFYKRNDEINTKFNIYKNNLTIMNVMLFILIVVLLILSNSNLNNVFNFTDKELNNLVFTNISILIWLAIIYFTNMLFYKTLARYGKLKTRLKIYSYILLINNFVFLWND